ncbi:MAG: hypothetical protein R3A10_10250 [Caldilineaceae bacterium]
MGPVELLLDPNDPADRARLIAAVAAADEAATALPSVAGYANIAPIVAAGLAAGRARPDRRSWSTAPKTRRKLRTSWPSMCAGRCPWRRRRRQWTTPVLWTPSSPR